MSRFIAFLRAVNLGGPTILFILAALAACGPNDLQPPTLPPLRPSATLTPAPLASPTQKPSATLRPTSPASPTPTVRLSPSRTPLPTNTQTPTLPPFSPVPGQIVFTSQQNGLADLYLINSDGSGLQRLTDNGNSNRDPAWSPDGAQLAFTSLTEGEEGAVQASEIYLMNADGSDQRSVTAGLRENGIAVFNPAWSPDGKRLAFDGHSTRQREEGFNTSYVYVMDTHNLAIRQVTQGREGAAAGCHLPHWLPDSYRIVMYCHGLMAGGLDLLDTRDGRQASLNDTPGAFPFAISHEGKVVAFAAGGAVELLNIDGSSDWLPISLPAPIGSFNLIRGFAWSPVRDDQMAAVAEIGLYLIHVTPDEWALQEIIGGMQLEGHERRGIGWSPDGSNIVFPSTIAGHDDLFIAPLDGSGLIRLTHSKADEAQPAWRPDR